MRLIDTQVSSPPHLAIIKYPESLASDNEGNIYCGTRFGEMWMIRKGFSWTIERVIWIGKLKNSPSDCILASLPTEIIKEILFAF